MVHTSSHNNCYKPATFLARLLLEKTRDIAIALASSSSSSFKTLIFCYISVITEDIYFKLRTCVHYPKSNPYYQGRQFRINFFFKNYAHFRIELFISNKHPKAERWHPHAVLVLKNYLTWALIFIYFSRMLFLNLDFILDIMIGLTQSFRYVSMKTCRAPVGQSVALKTWAQEVAWSILRLAQYSFQGSMIVFPTGLIPVLMFQ